MSKFYLFFILFSSLYAEKIGVIDFNKIFKTYDRAVQYNNEFSKEQKIQDEKIELLKNEYKLKKELLLSSETSKQKLKTKLNELESVLDKEIKKTQNEFYSKEREKMLTILLEVEFSYIWVATQNRFDYIFDKKSVHYGGIDITDSVLSFMNKKESFQLNNPLIIDS